MTTAVGVKKVSPFSVCTVCGVILYYKDVHWQHPDFISLPSTKLPQNSILSVCEKNGKIHCVNIAFI